MQRVYRNVENIYFFFFDVFASIFARLWVLWMFAPSRWQIIWPMWLQDCVCVGGRWGLKAEFYFLYFTCWLWTWKNKTWNDFIRDFFFWSLFVCVLSNKFANFWFITLTFRELNKLVSVLSKYSHEVPVTRFILQSHWLMQPLRQLRRSPVVNLMPLACWFTG